MEFTATPQHEHLANFHRGLQLSCVFSFVGNPPVSPVWLLSYPTALHWRTSEPQTSRRKCNNKNDYTS